MTIQQQLQNPINIIAETQFNSKPTLEKALTEYKLAPLGKSILGNFDNFYEYWVASQSENFFDIGTFIRLGSTIESNFRTYYMYRKGYSNLIELKADLKIKRGIFQRIKSGTGGVIELYNDELNIDITSNPLFAKVQETMIHRHLYAHNSGLIDEQYINDLHSVTGLNLLDNPDITKNYPAQDVYYFEPLKDLPHFIENTRKFFRLFS